MNRIVFNHLVGVNGLKCSEGLTPLVHLSYTNQFSSKESKTNTKVFVDKSKGFSLPFVSNESRLSCLLNNIHQPSFTQSYQKTNDFSILTGHENTRTIGGYILGRIGESSMTISASSVQFSIVKNSFIDLPPLLPPSKTPVVEKPKLGRLEMPTRFSLINELFAPSVYDFRVTINPEISDPRKLEDMKCISKKDKYGSIPPFNYSNTIMHIRRRKIKKHHRIKWVKNNLAAIKYTRLRRNIQKEKLFRAEIFAAVREAENFDAEKYVDDILNAIDKAPKPVDKEENLRKTIALMRKYRSETDLITPEFDDPVKPVHKNVFKIK